MRREEFDHVIRAAAEAVGVDEFVIIGSQAIHGEVSEPPEELLSSMEVDMYPEPAIPGRGNPVAYCMERHDMVLAKLVRGEQRDFDYAKAAMKAGLLDQSILRSRIPDLPVDAEVRNHVETLVSALWAARAPAS